jgi:hypothetical protein
VTRSWWPVLLALGLTILLVGVVVDILAAAGGALLATAAAAAWIRDIRRGAAAARDD